MENPPQQPASLQNARDVSVLRTLFVRCAASPLSRSALKCWVNYVPSAVTPPLPIFSGFTCPASSHGLFGAEFTSSNSLLWAAVFKLVLIGLTLCCFSEIWPQCRPRRYCTYRVYV